jgi:hypothetical protein
LRKTEKGRGQKAEGETRRTREIGKIGKMGRIGETNFSTSNTQPPPTF